MFEIACVRQFGRVCVFAAVLSLMPGIAAGGTVERSLSLWTMNRPGFAREIICRVWALHRTDPPAQVSTGVSITLGL